MLSIAEARHVVAQNVAPLAAERVHVGDALGRVLAEDVAATHDVPPFSNSAMDGYAVRSGPAGRALRVVDDARAGAPAQARVDADTAIRISTGAMVPEGADAVLQVELVGVDGELITLRDDVAPGRNLRAPGEDMRAGATVLRAGTRLGPVELGVAATAGRADVLAGCRPRVAVVATGDELVPPGAPLAPGQIHDSNAISLAAQAARAGAEVLGTAHAPDNRDQTGAELAAALEQADVLVISGGVSVGPHDHVKPALEALGVEERFWRVALRPGKPTWFGTRGDRLVFGLPGNPVSALVTFHLFVRPALLALQGAPFATPTAQALLAEAVPRNPGRDEAVRVRLAPGPDGRIRATPTGPQGSHQLTSLLGADALAIVTAGEGEAPAGTAVEVEML
jgi:molybdopterin molybdotransferase